MPPIQEWLGDLGLGEYAARFVENGIDLWDLRYLTDDDLKELGLLLGHRRRLMAALAKEDVAPSAARPTATVSSPPFGSKKQRAEIPDAGGERRYLTVLFCDLVDSTGIASRLDAEEWRDLVGAYFEAASATVAGSDMLADPSVNVEMWAMNKASRTCNTSGHPRSPISCSTLGGSAAAVFATIISNGRASMCTRYQD